MAREQFQNLSEPMFYILLALNKPLHGYGIMQKVEKISNGRLKIGAGTMYTLLSRFENENMIEIYSNEDRKKIYKITPKGTKLLQDEILRLNCLINDAKKSGDVFNEKDKTKTN